MPCGRLPQCSLRRRLRLSPENPLGTFVQRSISARIAGRTAISLRAWRRRRPAPHSPNRAARLCASAAVATARRRCCRGAIRSRQLRVSPEGGTPRAIRDDMRSSVANRGRTGRSSSIRLRTNSVGARRPSHGRSSFSFVGVDRTPHRIFCWSGTALAIAASLDRILNGLTRPFFGLGF
jgi:hypothetical protein